jgi:mannose-6-phosphate isomerase-like protein (cupin superfamily)
VDRRTHNGLFQLFRVDPKLPEGKRRTVELLAQDDITTAIVHVMKEGGENDLHAHRAQDEVWLVLEGQITFFGETHQEVARLNPRDGLFIPRGVAYYFSSTGTEQAVMIRFSAKATDVPNERLDYARPFVAEHAQSVGSSG